MDKTSTISFPQRLPDLARLEQRTEQPLVYLTQHALEHWVGRCCQELDDMAEAVRDSVEAPHPVATYLCRLYGPASRHDVRLYDEVSAVAFLGTWLQDGSLRVVSAVPCGKHMRLR